MSDDEHDQELLALLKQALYGGGKSDQKPASLQVLQDAHHVYDNAIDVAIDPKSTKEAAKLVWSRMQATGYSTETWSLHKLHPKAKDEATVAFIFTMDLLNFCFWPEGEGREPYRVEYMGTSWTGYWSLVANLRRAIDEGIPITTPSFWLEDGSEALLRHAFRSDSSTELPLLDSRLDCLREAGQVLTERFGGLFVNCLADANGSAVTLVGLLTDNFACFRDESRFERKRIRFYKRAQILVADLWACFCGRDYGAFHDIDQITMFADYRVPQMLHALGCLRYSPPLDRHIRKLKDIEHGHSWEVQLRGCSIWCVELLRREIIREHPEAHVNAILIDFFLYDMVKSVEGSDMATIPHHRTKSIWY